MIKPGHWVETLFSTCNWFFACIFIGEMVLKKLAKGFVCREHVYLRNWWNILDFAIMMVSIVLMTLMCSAGRVSAWATHLWGRYRPSAPCALSAPSAWHVCIYMHTYDICTYAYIHTCIHAHLHICAYAPKYEHSFICMYTHIHVYTFTCTNAHISHTYTHICTYKYTHTHAHTHMHTGTHTYIYSHNAPKYYYEHSCICALVHVYTHTYIHLHNCIHKWIDVHAYTHTHTHTHTSTHMHMHTHGKVDKFQVRTQAKRQATPPDLRRFYDTHHQGERPLDACCGAAAAASPAAVSAHRTCTTPPKIPQVYRLAHHTPLPSHVCSLLIGRTP